MKSVETSQITQLKTNFSKRFSAVVGSLHQRAFQLKSFLKKLKRKAHLDHTRIHLSFLPVRANIKLAPLAKLHASSGRLPAQLVDVATACNRMRTEIIKVNGWPLKLLNNTIEDEGNYTRSLVHSADRVEQRNVGKRRSLTKLLRSSREQKQIIGIRIDCYSGKRY